MRFPLQCSLKWGGRPIKRPSDGKRSFEPILTSPTNLAPQASDCLEGIREVVFTESYDSLVGMHDRAYYIDTT